jgi:hypothetical protein
MDEKPIPPYRLLSLKCKICGKPITVQYCKLKPDGNLCRTCWFNTEEYKEGKRAHMIELNKVNSLNPKWIEANKKMIAAREKDPDYLEKRKKGWEKRSQNPNWKINLKKSAKKRGKTWLDKQTKRNKINGQKIEIRKKISASKKGTLCGDKNPSWKGGISFEPYCEKFNNEFKERVRAFFGHHCIECGTPQNGEKLTVHHVDFSKLTCCDNSIPLFVPVCRSCHGKTNRNRPYWKEHFTDMINQFYGGKCYLTKEEYRSLFNP